MSDTKLSDNIADDDQGTTMVEDAATDEYMRKFEQVETRIQTSAKQLVSLHGHPTRDARLAALIGWAETQQKTVEDIYDLLVEMNNYWAKK